MRKMSCVEMHDSTRDALCREFTYTYWTKRRHGCTETPSPLEKPCAGSDEGLPGKPTLTDEMDSLAP